MEREHGKSLPIVDISHMMLNYSVEDTENDTFTMDPKILQIVDQVAFGFSTWGFLYLKGHQIDEKLIQQAFHTGQTFFELPYEEKMKLHRDSNDESIGYTAFGEESFELSRPSDLKEAFDWTLGTSKEALFKQLYPDFYDTNIQVLEKCKKLSLMLMRIVDLTLGLKEQSFLIKQHQNLCSNDFTKNFTIFRSLFYPPLPSRSDILTDQLRCGEHSDYGTFTLLFQDDAGGLQVVSPAGEYIDVSPVEGCIVVNVADNLEMWSSGRLKSTKHRVVFPSDVTKPRQSLAYFVQGDNDANVSCIDGSDKYPTVNVLEYLQKRFAETYTIKNVIG